MITISQEEIASWLDDLAQTYKLIAPTEIADILLYRPVQSSSDIVWNYVRPEMSIKDAFFPSTERLLSIEKHGQQIKLRETVPGDNQILFGVRPCDARGVLALDSMFIDTEPVDRYYASRRANSTIIGFACTEMADSCFCTSTGGAPDDPTGMDVMIYTVDNGYQVRVFTEKGENITKGMVIIDNDSEPSGHYQSANPIYQIPEKESLPANFNDTFWDEMSERCLSCRICAYVCPTCRCFDVRDEPISNKNGNSQFERIRCWDSCAGTIYRRIAGGHNPRSAKGERLRNRFFCKLYYYPEQYGPLACTGCGRCIESCPVNIDITEVIQHLQEVNS
jgi:sulfhydrogenase subunit beta (sulfur reductase)